MPASLEVFFLKKEKSNDSKGFFSFITQGEGYPPV